MASEHILVLCLGSIRPTERLGHQGHLESFQSRASVQDSGYICCYVQANRASTPPKCVSSVVSGVGALCLSPSSSLSRPQDLACSFSDSRYVCVPLSLYYTTADTAIIPPLPLLVYHHCHCYYTVTATASIPSLPLLLHWSSLTLLLHHHRHC